MEYDQTHPIKTLGFLSLYPLSFLSHTIKTNSDKDDNKGVVMIKRKMSDDANNFKYFFRMSEEMSHCYGRCKGRNENLFFVFDYRVKKYITLNIFTDGRLTHYIVNTRKEAA